ncbi:hypothetical protein BH10ACI2_BH10ACI2_19590 [soil metagenome]
MDDSVFENESRVQTRIQKAFEDLGLPKSAAYDIGFHMTDWFGDIQEMESVFGSSNDATDDEVIEFVMKFLAHVPNHLNAAHKLSGFGKLDDVFGVGIFEDDE